MIPAWLISIICAVEPNWNTIVDDIRKLFLGDGSTLGIFGGMDPAIVGIVILLFFMVLTIIFGLGMIVGSVILLPAMFAVFQFIPNFRIVVAIICGIVFGFGLHRFIKR